MTQAVKMPVKDHKQQYTGHQKETKLCLFLF